MYRLGLTAFGERMSAAFWLDYTASALTTLALFDLGRRLVSLRFGALVAAIYAFASLPAARYPLGGFLERSVTEPFIVALAAAAACSAAIAISREGKHWPFAAGLLIGTAAVFKQTAFVYWPAFTIWTWLSADLRRARRFGIYAGMGAVIAPLLAVGWLWSHGVLHDAYVATIEYNMAYLALGGQSTAGTLDRFAHEVWRRMKTDEVWALGTLSAAIATYAWWRDSTRTRQVASLGILWLAAAVIAAAANGPRLFSQSFVPLAGAVVAVFRMAGARGGRVGWHAPDGRVRRDCRPDDVHVDALRISEQGHLDDDVGCATTVWLERSGDIPAAVPVEVFAGVFSDVQRAACRLYPHPHGSRRAHFRIRHVRWNVFSERAPPGDQVPLGVPGRVEHDRSSRFPRRNARERADADRAALHRPAAAQRRQLFGLACAGGLQCSGAAGRSRRVRTGNRNRRLRALSSNRRARRRRFTCGWVVSLEFR